MLSDSEDDDDFSSGDDSPQKKGAPEPAKKAKVEAPKSDEDSEEELDTDDDSYDDSDEDDAFEQKSRRGPKKQGAAHGGFIITEAEVDDDDDDEDLVAEDGFVEPPTDLINNDKIDTQEDASQARHLHNIWNDETAEDIAEYYKKKYADRVDEGEDDGEEYEAPAEIEQQSLQPSVKDPSLWMVRCSMGEEKNAAFILMRKMIAMEGSDQALQIKSAIAVEGLKQYIYVEAYKQSHIKHAIEGISALRRGYWKQNMVPLKEMTDVLRVFKDVVQVKQKSWVRIKRGLYKEDVAQVDYVNTARNQITLKIIPRIDYTTPRGIMRLESDNPEKRKRKRRPAQKMFDKETLQGIGGDISLDENFYVFENNRYRNGFLYKSMAMSAIITEGVKPTLSELEKFEISVDDADLELGRSTAKDEITHTFVPGDMVRVADGELINLLGKILSVDGNTITIQPKHEDLKDPLEFTAAELQKYFKVGDHTKVICGKYEGDTGLIVRVEENVIVLFSDLTFHEMKVKPDDLQLCADKSSGVDSMGQHSWGDLVSLDPQTVGVIVRLDREQFAVLNQHGKVVQVKHQAVTKKRVARGAVALDSEQNQVETRDIVKVIEGEFEGKQGEVKHLFRGHAFIHCKLVLDNGGLFVVKSKSLLQCGGTKTKTGMNMGGPSSGFQSPRMSPMRSPMQSPRGAGGSGTPSQSPGSSPAPRGRGQQRGRGRGRGHPGGRDEQMIGKTVRIAQGPFKGYIGIVKDATDSLARVELHTDCRTISVDRNRLAFISGQVKGGGVTAYGHTPLYSQGQTPMYGNQTPMHGSRTPMYGNQTPMHDGSRTPSYRTPSHAPSTPSHDPSRTPSHGGGGGGAWDPAQPNTPARPSDEFEYFEGGPSPGFGSTPSPQTPSHGTHGAYNAPYTPGTPMSNVFGSGDSYSPMHTPSPLHGNPLTPGAGLGPMSPAYQPQTPMSQFEDEPEFNQQLTTDIEVKISNDFEDAKFAGKTAVLRILGNDDTANVTVYDTKESVSVPTSAIEVVTPAKKDRIKFISGDDKDDTGMLINIDGPDGIIKMDQQPEQSLKILQLHYLAKYVPPDE